MNILAQARKLITEECANFQRLGPLGIKNFCWEREKSNNGGCIFFSDLDNPKCRYFKKAVLPLDKDLKAIFSREVLNLGIQDGQKRMIRKTCARCPETFLAKGNAQRFCPRCRRTAYRDKAREWDRLERKNPERTSQPAI